MATCGPEGRGRGPGSGRGPRQVLDVGLDGAAGHLRLVHPAHRGGQLLLQLPRGAAEGHPQPRGSPRGQGARGGLGGKRVMQ